MSRGGKRTGSGRKIGAVTTRTRDIANQAYAEGIMPLEVMLRAMRSSYDHGDIDAAVSYARQAAPYVHPRLSAIEPVSQHHQDNIIRIMREARARLNRQLECESS